jgi:uncharacterized protein (DUF433 family)
MATTIHPRVAQRAVVPRYTFAEAERIIHRPAPTLRRWAAGHDRLYQGKPRHDPPLIHLDGELDGETPPLSFLNLIELRFLASWRQTVPLPAIREALDFSATQLGAERPLLDLRFKRSGRDLFIDYDSLLLVATRSGQLAWPEAVDSLFASLDYDEKEQAAYRWWPLGRARPVLLDTRVNGGRPTTAKTGVRTISIASRLREGWSPADVLDDTAATLPEIAAAAEIEGVRLAAA